MAEADAVDFPLEELVLSMTIHQSPRRLKIGKAMGEAVAALGRSILPGCKRATQLARLYTLRMVKGLATKFPQAELYQHVDDMTVTFKAPNLSEMRQLAVDYVKEFAENAEEFKMDISGKSTIVPMNDATKTVSRIAERWGILLSVEKQGVDIGADTAAAARRATRNQRTRVDAASKRAKRAKVLARARKKSRRPMGVQIYTAP